jgi:hypothetical protein
MFALFGGLCRHLLDSPTSLVEQSVKIWIDLTGLYILIYIVHHSVRQSNNNHQTVQ